MKLWLRFFLGAALASGFAAAAHAQLSATGITASPASVLPGDSVTYTIAVSNGTASNFTNTSDFSITLTNIVSGATFLAAATAASPTGGFIPAAVAASPPSAASPGTGTFTFTVAVPKNTTEAGAYRATVTMSNITGQAGTPTFSVTATALTVTGKPDLAITGLTYAAGTSYVGGTAIPMTLTWVNNQSTNGTQNVPYVPGKNGFPNFVRIQVVLSTNPTFGDADDFQLTINDISAGSFGSNNTTDNVGNASAPADWNGATGTTHTYSWNQLLPGNFSGSYYVLARINSLKTLSENDPPVLTVNGNNDWIGSALNPTATLINLLPTNFPTVYLASHATGATTTANGYSDNPSISTDGRYTVFASDASTLVSGDTNSARDIFMFDSQTNLVRRLNTSQQGNQGNAASNNPAISGNGRWVVFASDASNMVLGDTNGFSDIFVVDTLNNGVGPIRLSVSSAGAQSNNPSFRPAISSTGRYVVFESTATNLDPNYTALASSTGGVSHIYLRDRDVSNSGTYDTAGNVATKLVDADVTTPASVAGNAGAIQAAISSDGSTIAFASKATNIAPTATTASRQHVYVRATVNVGTATSGIKIVSVVNGSTTEGNADSQTPSLTSSGNWVAFASLATNLVAGDTNGVSDIFVYDTTSAVATPTVRRVSLTNSGAQGTDPSAAGFQLGSINPTISATGRYVAFASLDANLTGGDSNGQYQGSGATAGAVTVAGGTITAIAVSSGGSNYSQASPPRVIITDPTGTGASFTATVSAAGVVTGFVQVSAGSGYSATPSVVVSSDANSALDIFVRDRDSTASGTFDTGTPTTQMVSVNRFGYQTNGLLGIPSTAASNIYPVISADGRFVAFPSDAENTAGLAFGATNLLPLDSNGLRDVFLFDRRTNAAVTAATPPSVSITNPGTGTALVNTAVSVTASATTTVGVVSSVQFYVNGTSIGTSSVFPYSATWTPTAVGSYTLSALVTDSFGNLGVSTNITVQVNAQPSVGITAPVGGTSIVVGTVTTVSGSAAKSNPTGTIASVQFFANGASLGTVTTAPYQVSWTPSTTGTISLTAVATETVGTQTVQSTSPAVSVSIIAASGGGTTGGSKSPPPTVSLSPAPPATSSVNTPITLSATAQASTGYTIASVQYFANGVSIGSASAFPYRLVWTPAALGSYAVTAVATDNVGTSTTSSGATVTVSGGTAPTIALVSPNAGASYAVGSPIALSATTTLGAGLITSVDFFVNNIAIGSKSAPATGQGAAPFFNLEWTPAAAGTYVFTAVVTDTSGNRTTSTSVTVSVSAVSAPVVTVTSPASGTAIVVNKTLTVAASATAGTGASIASVRFLANGTPIGTSSVFPYATSWTPTSPGTYYILAVATDSFGTQTTSSPIAVTVGAGSSTLPWVYLTSVPTGTNVTSNTKIYLTANAGDPDGTVTSVEFYASGTLIGSKSTAPYAITWTPTAATTYSITAVATDDAGNRTTSTAASITSLIQSGVVPVASINFNNPTVDTPIGSATSTTTTALFTPVPVTYGSKLLIGVQAVDEDGSIANVQFFANGTNIATVSAAPYYTTYTLNTLSDVVITAIATDNLGNAVYTTPILITTQPSAVTNNLVTLVSPVNGSTYVAGRSIIFSATHNFGTVTPPKIDFYVNGQQFSTVSAAPYQVVLGLTRSGTYDIHAVVRSGNTTTVSAASRITVTSNAAPTAAISSPNAGATYVIGTPVTIVGSVGSSSGIVRSVQFFVNGSSLATVTTAPFNAPWNPVSPGIYTLTALATDDVGNQTLSSPVTVTFTGNAPPSVSISTPTVGARIVAGSAVSLVAAASDVDGTISTVRFLANGNVVGTGSAAPYTAVWTPTASGTYSVVAQATDNSGNVSTSTAVAVNVLVNQPPVVSLSTPTNGSVFRTGAPAGLSATATDPDGTIANVQFLANGNVVGTATSAPYSVFWTPGSAGTYSVVAQATDNTGNVASSSAASVTVLANQLPVVSFTAPTNGGVVRAGSAVTLSASATDPDGTISSVQFFANGVSVGAPITTLGTGGYRQGWTPAAEGVYTLTATAIDNSGAASNAVATVLAVNPSNGAGDTFYTGTFSGLGDAGRFAVVSISGKSAVFIGYSTLGAGKVYFYPSIPVDAARGFSLTDSSGKVLLAGKVDDTAATITKLDGAAVTMIGIVSFPSGATVATGYYTGSLAGRPASQLAAIVAPDASIIFFAADGSVRTAGAGFVDTTGAFRNLAALGGGVFTGKADPANNFLTGNLTGPLAGGVMGAVQSGVAFSDGSLRNLSSRGQVGTGANVLIAGFSVGGSATKQLLIRAVGPSLAPYGVTGALADPQIQLFNGNSVFASNDNWNSAANLLTAANSVGAFALSSNLESVVLVNLGPGNYTVQVNGANGTSGVALVELYDVDTLTPYSSQKVMNISTRALVGTDQNRLLAGFMVNGNTAKKVLVRAVGPALATYGVTGFLVDPVLRIINNKDQSVVRENDNWEIGNDISLVSDAAAKTGAFAFATGSKDAAILMSLPPGSYSADVTGSGGTTGIALVEVYEVP